MVLAMDLLTVHETAAMLKLNPETVRRHIASGRLEAVRVGRRVRVRREAVESFLTPVAPKAEPMPKEPYTFVPPSAEEIARRQALLRTILANRQERKIAPLTSAGLVHIAREQEEKKYDRR